MWPSGPLQTGPSHSGFTATGVGGHVPQNEVEKMMKASHISEEVKYSPASGIPQTSCNTHTHTHTSDGETACAMKKSEEWGEQCLFHRFGVHSPPPSHLCQSGSFFFTLCKIKHFMRLHFQAKPPLPLPSPPPPPLTTSISSLLSVLVHHENITAVLNNKHGAPQDQGKQPPT